jgi:hypothetical protein
LLLRRENQMPNPLRHFLKVASGIFISCLAGVATIAIYLFLYAVEDFSPVDVISFSLLLVVFGSALCLLSHATFFYLRKKMPRLPAWSLPLFSIFLVTTPVAILSARQALLSHDLPLAEFLVVTAAFLNLSVTFGLVSLRLFGGHPFNSRLLTLGYATVIIGLIAVLPNLVSPIAEALLSDAANGVVVTAVRMQEPRSGHTATLLKDGRILLTGGMLTVVGQELPTATTEIFDPAKGTIEWGPKMLMSRAGHTATLLNNGDVLITGGVNEHDAVESAELYKSTTGEFVEVGLMTIARERHSASLLQNGQVLITGGTIVNPSAHAELYDAEARVFRPTSQMKARRAAHTSTVLADGRVLIAGGAESLGSVLQSVEIFDAHNNSFTLAGQMQTRRYKHSAVLLSNGTVLLLGGADERDWSGRRSTVEIYDPLENTSQIAGSMNRGRFKFPNAVVLSIHNEIVVAGGGRRVEVFDRANAQFKLSAGSLGDEWFYSTATPLANGSVFIAGGYNSSLVSTPQTWTYQPPAQATATLPALRH